MSDDGKPRTVVLLAVRARDWPSFALHRASEFADQMGADLWILELRGHFHGNDPTGGDVEEARAWCERVLQRPFPASRIVVRDERLEKAAALAVKETKASFLVLPAEFQTSAAQLAVALKIPVLAARLSSTGRSILEATDVGDSDLPLIRYGADLCAKLGEDLVVIHNVSRTIVPVPPEVFTELEPDEGLVASRRETLRRATHDLPAAAHTVVDVETRSSAAEAVLDAARAFQPDLIVMGAHRHTWLGRMLLPSTTEEVLDKSVRSVLVVPLPEAHGGPAV